MQQGLVSSGEIRTHFVQHIVSCLHTSDIVSCFHTSDIVSCFHTLDIMICMHTLDIMSCLHTSDIVSCLHTSYIGSHNAAGVCEFWRNLETFRTVHCELFAYL